mgnify:CR=1 FL=1
MAIIYNPNKKIFTLHTAHTTYQMQVDPLGYLLHLYYGEKTNSSMDYVLTYADRGFSGNPYAAGMDRTYSLDALPQEYPSLGTGDYRNIALNIKNEKGVESADLLFKSYEIRSGKYQLQGLPAVWADENEAQTLEIVLADENAQVEVHLLYGVLEETDVITRSVRIKNTGTGQITIEKAAAACLDFVQGDFDVLRFYGKHAMERNLERTPLGHGTIAFGSRRGTSSHQYNPAVILAEKGTTETAGSCYGMLFVYSGNFSCEAEKDQFNQTRLLLGLNEELFSYPLAAGETFTVPEVILSYSADGLSALSQQYHNCIRNHVCRSKYVHMQRPVLINSWEAAYFDFTGDTIVDLAKEAASLGIDMVVMDDGWFGKRNDDNSSLGDWWVNETKLGGSLADLITRVHEQGVKFGIWIEPEMVNEDSDLYRAHPDWAIRIPGKKPVRSRNQLLLDFSRKEVRDCVFDQICAVLDQGKIDYVKWDMNRHMSDLYSAVTAGGELPYRYMLGLYEVLERIFTPRPHILLETCSSGGNRFDLGMLCYSPQIWSSDDTDPIERLSIQKGLSYFYPPCTMGAHVSQSPHQQTLRQTPLSTRFNVAAFGVLGYELDLGELSPQEKKQVAAQIEWYKKYRPTLQYGDLFRVPTRRQGLISWAAVAPDKKQAVVLLAQRLCTAAPPADYLTVPGLKSEARYRVVAVPQQVAVARFGGLVKHIAPVKLSTDGLVLRTVNRHYALPDGSFTAMASGAALASGIPLNDQFLGTGYHKDLRLWGDFGSQLYLVEQLDENEEDNTK